MSIALGVFVLLPLLAAAVLIRLGIAMTGSTPASATVRRSLTTLRLPLLMGGLAVIPATAILILTDSLGRNLVLIVPTALLCIHLGLVGATVAMDRLPRERGDLRSAGLAPRRTTDSVPRIFAAVAALGVVAATATLVVTTRTAAEDPGSGTMRAFATAGQDYRSTFSPYLGSFYTGPLLLALAASVVLTAVVAFGARRWGALDQPDADLALRLRVTARSTSLTAAMASYQIALGAIMLNDAADAVRRAPGPDGSWAMMSWLTPTMLAVALLITLWSCAMFIAPTLRGSRR